MQKNRLTERLRSLRFTSLVLRSSSTILPEKRRCRIYSGWLFSSETVKPRQRWPKLRLMRPPAKGGAIPKTLWVRVPTAPTLDWVCMTWSSTKRDLFKGGSFFLLIKRPPLKQPRDFHPGGQLTFWRTFSGLDKGSLIASGERFFFRPCRKSATWSHRSQHKEQRKAKKNWWWPQKSLFRAKLSASATYFFPFWLEGRVTLEPMCWVRGPPSPNFEKLSQSQNWGWEMVFNERQQHSSSSTYTSTTLGVTEVGVGVGEGERERGRRER